MKPLFFSLPPEVHPDCRDFVTQVDMLLLWRQQETVEGTIKQPVDEQEDDWGPRKWHRKELEDMVYSSYKRMRQGHITRPPRREVVLEIADYLHCSFEERNRLLIAAHTLPVEQYLTGPALANMVHEIREVACVLPMPALIMNRDWQILYFNAAMLHLYDLSSEQIATIPASSLNFLQLLCDPALPLYANLIGNRKSWTRMVLQTIQGFKTANQFSRYEPWYQQLVQRLLLFPEFAQCWEQVAQTKILG